MLQAIEISKVYPNSHAGLLPVSFVVSEGECLAVVGESGSGKTTLLQILAGFLPTETGELRLQNRLLPAPQSMLVRGYPDVQLVPQDFGLLPNHKVWENILFPIRHLPKATQESRLAYLAELLGLADLLTRLPRELSGGQQQRVAVARALANEPAVLLLDEPFNQADTQTKAHLEQAFVALKKKARTAIVLVTHDAPQALSLADKMLILQAGKALQYDSPTRLYEQPQDAYTAMLFGQINFIAPQKAIRAEHCHISASPTKISGKVLHNFYQGHRYKVVLRVGKGNVWEVFHPFPLQEQEKYYIDFETSNIMHFGYSPQS